MINSPTIERFAMSKRFDIIGSLLRPDNLLKYKREIENREDIHYPFYNDFEGYEETEEKAIADIVKKQIEHGIQVISDGEFSKAFWHLDFLWGMDGIKRYISDSGFKFKDLDNQTKFETRKDIGLELLGNLSGKNHHFIHIYKKIEKYADGHTVKLCIPSPAHMFGNFVARNNYIGPYKTKGELAADLIKAYKEFVEEYAQAGGEILQMDDCIWQIFADDNPSSPYLGKPFQEILPIMEEFIEINNAIIDFGKTTGLKMWTHNCRGNYKSRSMSEGSYTKLAAYFLKKQRYDRFFLEWDDDRAGSLEALKVFQERDGEVVLGLLSSKTGTLCNEDRAKTMLKEASQILDKERLLLSHQCGFASCDNGNELNEQQQWAKIDQGQKLAKEFWGE